jgi:hypothetical protein
VKTKKILKKQNLKGKIEIKLILKNNLKKQKLTRVKLQNSLPWL